MNIIMIQKMLGSLVMVVFLFASLVLAEEIDEREVFMEVDQLMKKAIKLEREYKDYEAAIAVYTQLIKIDPDKYVYYFNRGVLYGYLEEVDKAIADYDKALELNPSHVTARANRAVAYQDKGDLDKAISETEKCVEMDPNHFALINLQGMYMAREEKQNKK